MHLTLHLPASAVPAIAPVPYPDAQWPQVHRGSGISAQDPLCSSNKELIPAVASANVRAQTGWFFISLYATPNTTCTIYPQALIHQLAHSFTYQWTHPTAYPAMFHPLSFTHPPTTHLPKADGTLTLLQNEDMVSTLRGLTT